MGLIALKSKGQIVIPQNIRQEMALSVGDLLEARVEGGKITLTPKSAADLAIAEGLEDIRKGRVYGPFDTVDQMLSSLKGKRRKPQRKSRRVS